MGFNFELPELQTVVVIAVGLLVGWMLVPKVITRPIIFGLVTTVLFFASRYVAAVVGDVSHIETTSGAMVFGNGILVALVLYLIYVGSMLVGDYLARRQWDVHD